MIDDEQIQRRAFEDAILGIDLFAVDPHGLGGVALRAQPSDLRDRLCARIRALLPQEAPLLRVPIHITEDRLLGGLALAATLRAGHVVTERGVLASADGGAVIVAMAERIEGNVVSHLCAAIDRGEVALERDGIAATLACRIGVVVLDEGEGDERAPAPLLERAAIQLDLSAIAPRTVIADDPDPERIAEARALLASVAIDDEVVVALCQAASALGVCSLRGPLLAAATARAHAALHGRDRVEEEDAVVAARLVLGPRATRMPVAEDAEEDDDEPSDDSSPEAEAAERDVDEEPSTSGDEGDASEREDVLDAVVLAAAKSAVPQGLLEMLLPGREPRTPRRSDGRAGASRASTQSGRPAGTRPSASIHGERLNVVETLRAAAPWQRVRRREATRAFDQGARRVDVRKEDFRITRFKRPRETCVIFSVDASGSAALQRLAEAKGAVEQVLADCYVRRDHVALVAFRGASASLLLPPTRSLARVRRSLAELAGGGTTPLAAGIGAALDLAIAARARGRTPVVVLMTDGRANVARDGREGGIAGTADALAAAKAIRAAGIRTLFLDTAPRPKAHARLLANELGARYLPLPYLDAVGIAHHVQSLAEGAP